MPVSPLHSRRLAALGLLALAGLLIASAFCARATAATPPTYKGSSADGEVAFFETAEQLVPGDTDVKRDIYVRSFDPTVGDAGAYVTREISTGPTGGNDGYDAHFEKAGDDGQKAFFFTDEALVGADTDRKTDVYVRDLGSGKTKLVSQGAALCRPACGNGAYDAGFAGASGGGDQVFLVTAERLDPGADQDGSVDVYERNLLTETTILVSAPASPCLPSCGNGAFNATLRGSSTDGSKAFFATSEKLAENDLDATIDIYARALPNGPTTLVSAGDPACAPCGNENLAPVFHGSSADGSQVFFTTAEGLVSEDEDGASDIYRRNGGTTTLVSAGSELEPANFAAATADGSRVFYVTAESLTGADDNEADDVYLWQGGASLLVTSGSCCGSNFNAITEDGGSIVFTTLEPLVEADADSSADVYERELGGPPVLVSTKQDVCPECGDGSAPARFNRASSDGSLVFFTTDERFANQDFDLDDDIYARRLDDGTTVLSTPPGNCPVSSCDATFVDASTDAKHVFFQTLERSAADDIDSEPDIYERGPDALLGAQATRLVSTGNSSELELGPPAPLLQGTVPGSPGSSLEPALIGEAREGSSIKIYATASCSGEPVKTGTAEELAGAGLSIPVTAGSTTTFRATAEAEGFTSACSDPVSYKQEDPLPPPPSDGTGESGATGGSASPDGAKTRHGGISYLTPQPKFTFGPSSKTHVKRPVFRFSDLTGQPGTRFSCRLDRGRWRSCSSPTRTKLLKPGRHRFSLKAVNALGVPGPSPVSRAFKVVAK